MEKFEYYIKDLHPSDFFNSEIDILKSLKKVYKKMEDFLDQNSIDYEFKLLSYIFNILKTYKNITISVITGIFIYFRRLDYYRTLPRYNIRVSLLIMIWTYLAILEPWSIIIGLVLLNLFGYKHLQTV